MLLEAVEAPAVREFGACGNRSQKLRPKRSATGSLPEDDVYKPHIPQNVGVLVVWYI